MAQNSRAHVALLLSVTPEAARRLQDLQVAEVVLTDRLQAFGERRRLEILRQAFEPVLILGLQVNKGLDGIGQRCGRLRRSCGRR